MPPVILIDMVSWRRSTAWLWLVISASFLCAQDAGSDALLKRQIESTVRAHLKDLKFPGLSIAAAKSNRIVYSAAFGLADLEQQVPATTQSVHRLASLSKPITAVMVMDLVQAGRMRLDESIRRYLPELSQRYQSVTVRHLLTHQAGVRGYKGSREVLSTTHYSSLREAMKSIVDDPLLFQPGMKIQYTTLGFTVLGAAAEAIAGKSFDALAQEFFSGHNLNTIVVDNPFWIVRRRVRGYRLSANGGFENAPFFDPSNKYPGGGFLGSAEECVRFLIAVNTGEILQPKVVQQMWTPQTLNDGKATTYGLGWGLAAC